MNRIVFHPIYIPSYPILSYPILLSLLSFGRSSPLSFFGSSPILNFRILFSEEFPPFMMILRLLSIIPELIDQNK